MHIAAGLSGDATELLLNYGGNPNVRYSHLINLNHKYNSSYQKFCLITFTVGVLHSYRSVEGTTPMHVACMWGKRDVLIALLQNGGDPFIKDQVIYFSLQEA